MNKLVNYLLALGVLFGSSKLVAQDASVFTQFKIPTFEYKQLYVEGQDFLNYMSQGDVSDFNMNLDGYFNYRNQSPMMTYWVGDNLSYVSNSHDNGTVKTDVSVMENYLNFGARKWLMDDAKGVFAFGNGTLNYSKTTDVDAVKSLPLTLGAGYGRVTEEYAVAQAIVVLKELGADVSNENILKLADIIAKSNSGYYSVQFKDDANIEYYKDIASVTGKADDAIKVQRILGGGIYQTTNRANGWWGMVSFSNTFMTDLDPAPKGSVILGGEYAMPMDLDKQFRAWAWYNNSLEDAPKVNTFTLCALFSIDHNYLWASKAEFNYTQYMPDPGDGKSDWTLGVESNYYVLNQMSAYGRLAFSNLEGSTGNKDMKTEFKVGARYYIW